jgi:hypothetical protein
MGMCRSSSSFQVWRPDSLLRIRLNRRSTFNYGRGTVWYWPHARSCREG